MDDRKLLELAAKAAGICPVDLLDDIADNGSVERNGWNPLTDDGDALRLAVKLDMLGDFCGDSTAAYGNTWHCKNKGDDAYAATRRAIVSAAAEIGKEM